MNQQAIDTLKAERDELRKCAAWYEELRTATDGGSESMTHEDAIEHVLALAAENKVLREALLNIARKAEALKRECGDDPASPQAIRNGRYMHLVYLAHAVLTKEATK